MNNKNKKRTWLVFVFLTFNLASSSQICKELNFVNIKKGDVIYYSNKENFSRLYVNGGTFPCLDENKPCANIEMIFSDSTISFQYKVTSDKIGDLFDGEINYKYYFIPKLNINYISYPITNNLVSVVLTRSYIIKMYSFDEKLFYFLFTPIDLSIISKKKSKKKRLKEINQNKNSFSIFIVKK